MSYMHFDFKPIDPRRASWRFDAGGPIETGEADGLAGLETSANVETVSRPQSLVARVWGRLKRLATRWLL